MSLMLPTNNSLKYRFVVKVYKKDAEQKASRELYFEDVKMQMVCRDWGNKFNQKKVL